MINMRTPHQHRRNQRQCLPTRIRATNPTPQPHRLIHQLFQPQPVHQRPSRQQPRVSHQTLIVENHPQPINVLRYSTHRKCLPTLSQYPLVIRLLSQVRGTFLHQSTPSTPNQLGGFRLRDGVGPPVPHCGGGGKLRIGRPWSRPVRTASVPSQSSPWRRRRIHGHERLASQQTEFRFYSSSIPALLIGP